MKVDLLRAATIGCLPWLEAETYGPIFGTKGARLLAIPRCWTPDFFLLSPETAIEIVQRNTEVVSKLWPLVQDIAARTKIATIRSSVVAETIWDRGTYHSQPISVGLSADGGVNHFVEAVEQVVASAGGRACGIIVQEFYRADEQGEFGNLQRVSKTRDHWELSVRGGDLVQVDRYNSQRDTAPSVAAPLVARAALSRERLFGSISAWANNELMRGVRTRINCEWVRYGETFYIVQVDAEDDDTSGINPMQLFIEPTIRSALSDGQLLAAADPVARKKWDKLKVLDELFPNGSDHIPALYVVPVIKLSGSGVEEKLKEDFERMLGANIVVRTSVAAGSEKLTNLPKTDCLTAAEAARWCVNKSQELCVRHPNIELSFVAHRYIASRSSAWVKADHRTPTVEVHGTWGLPDALQFCPYDIWEVHVPTDEITEYPSYKSNVLLLQSDGSWKYERVKNDVARFQSISRGQISDMAQRSLLLSQRMGKPCHIMWFVGCQADNGQSVNIPWYWTEAHQTDQPERGRVAVFDVCKREDLARIGPLQKNNPRLAISLKPQTVDLLRDNSFLAAVAEVAVPLAVPVLLSGSTLAHAYYQLRKHGCIVISEGDKEHLRVRRQANFGKLVRDRIPEKIANQKEQQVIATIPRGSRIGFLIGKFVEELLEARESADLNDLTTELADVYEVFRALAATFEVELDAILVEAERKLQKVGGFEEGRLLLGTSLPKSGNDELIREESITPEVFGELGRNGVYRLPFAFLGFNMVGQAKSLHFPKDRVSVHLTLQRDALEISVVSDPKQLSLDL